MQLQVSTKLFELVSLVLLKVFSDVKNGLLIANRLISSFCTGCNTHCIVSHPIKTKTGVCYEQEAQPGRLAGSGTLIILRQVTSFEPVCVCLWLTGLVKYHTGAKELLYVSAGPCLHDNVVTRNKKVFTLCLVSCVPTNVGSDAHSGRPAITNEIAVACRFGK